MHKGFGAEGVNEVFGGEAEDAGCGCEVTLVVGTKVSVRGCLGAGAGEEDECTYGPS